ncbi:hypothetical protein Nhal_1530 [Nitrosococcus halophilus Nc 4]|uniref:Uncharacterized protein n=1 Tax=Nitrosococcus halophilus (strain Nc4) TaxID=472759 RepID=D5C1N8_NITHN|nr:hypothetical protein Nhal_1530 [Nitrosococcus halophilus Nc 4]
MTSILGISLAFGIFFASALAIPPVIAARPPITKNPPLKEVVVSSNNAIVSQNPKLFQISVLLQFFWGGVLSSILLFWSSFAVGAQPPTIRLFPTTVIENVKEAGQVARDMEISLQDVIADMEQQWKLYQESKCEGYEGDEGCSQISQQMGNKYLEMLSLMDSQLPQIEHSVQATIDSLENRLRQELGQKLTARDLQEVLVSETAGDNQLSNRKSRRHSSGRLSERFRQYYNLVLQASSHTGGNSVALAAADIYLDSKEVLELIQLTQGEINRARLMIELRNQFGSVTPEMHEVVTGVKKILLGEKDMATAYETLPPAGTFPEEYQSPLKF